MRKSTRFFSLLVSALLLPAVASAQTAGSAEYNALKSLLTGNLGLGVAILCAAAGCYTWLISQKAGPGITLIIIGATIALLPNLMDAMHVNLCPIVSDLGGTCATQSFVNGQ